MKHLHILLLAAALALVGCNRDDPQALVASAKEYIAKRDYSTAIIQLKNALQKEPNDGEARYLLGIASLENADITSARIELDKARELGYAGEELQIARARVMLAEGEYDKLLAEFSEKSLTSPALNAELHALVGLGELAKHRTSEAKVAFHKALAIDAGNATANVGLARLAASQRDLDGAIARVDSALKAEPASADALSTKADLLAASGKDSAAEKVFREAVAAAPRQIAPRLALIQFLVRAHSLDKAIAEVASLQKVAPHDPRTAYARALVLNEQGDAAHAHQAILQVLKVAPNHVPSLSIAATTALKIGAFAEAESHLRKALLYAPDSVTVKRLLVVTHLRMGQLELALSEAKDLVTPRTDDPNTLMVVGEAYLANGQVKAASRAFENARAIDPDNTTIQTRLALIRVANGDSKEGMKELEAASAANANDYQADVALITAHLRQRQPDDALRALKGLEEKQPTNPLTHYLRGSALLMKGDSAGARASFAQAIKLNPTYMPAVAKLAQLDLADKKPEAAKKRYEVVLKNDPNNEQALLGLATVLRMTRGSQSEIEDLLKQAVASNPSSLRSHSALVSFYVRSRAFPKALTAAQNAQAALPNSTGATDLLGSTQLAAGQNVQAVSTFTRLAQMSPKSPEPLVKLAKAYLALKQPDEAIKSLRAALALRPDLVALERELVAVYMAQGRHGDALREARGLQTRHPEQPLGYVLEGQIFAAQKDWRNAERAYREGVKKYDLPILVIRTHEVMRASGRKSEADAMADKWIAAHPKDASVLAYLGQRDIAAKRYSEAVERFKSAVAREPRNPLFLNNLAWAAKALNQPDALDYAERAHQLAPQNPAIMDTLGAILVERGENDRGLELLRRASELAPQTYQIRLNLAKALVKAGRKDAARKELEPLTKLDSRLAVQREAAALLAGL